MRIEYLDQDDIVNIIGTQLNIYDNSLSLIKSFNVPIDDHVKSSMKTYKCLTAEAISLSIANMFDLTNGDRKDLNKRIELILSDTKLHPVDIKGKVVLVTLKYLREALCDLKEKLYNRGQQIEDAANDLDSKINNLERAVATSIKNNQ
jgi:hypothetical protein